MLHIKLAQFAVRCALPPRRSESPVCATDNKPSCVLHLLGWFIGSRGFSSLERRPEFWVLQNHSFDTHFTYLGPVSCVFTHEFPRGLLWGVAAVWWLLDGRCSFLPEFLQCLLVHHPWWLQLLITVTSLFTNMAGNTPFLKLESVKLLEEDIKRNLLDACFWQSYFGYNIKITSNKTKNKQVGLHHIKELCTTKETINKIVTNSKLKLLAPQWAN